MSDVQLQDTFTDEEKNILEPFVSNVDRPIFVLRNLPEVIKGALFSRYSRSKKGLRRLLLDEFILNRETAFQEIASFAKHSTSSGNDQALAIEKAQAFYDRILDGYGDDSIGELGGAHLACEQVSNVASKFLEDSRIGGSPLEKSTRYITFDTKINNEYMFVKEPTLMASRFRELYLETNNMLFDTYAKIIEPMKQWIMKTTPQQGGVPDKAYAFSVRAKACDTLRGLLPASAMTNVGIFGNGRFFENLIIKLCSNPLKEMQLLADMMQKELDTVIPSFVRRAQPGHRHFSPFKDYFSSTRASTEKHAAGMCKGEQPKHDAAVELVDYDRDAEPRVLAAMLYPHTNLSFSQLLAKVKAMTDSQKEKVIRDYIGERSNRRHKPGRALEHVYYTFDLLCDYGSFRDLHRHRMLTQERQLLSCDHGFHTPPELKKAGLAPEYESALQKAKKAFDGIRKEHPREAQYVVPFAYRIRWYFKINLRALYWLSELRSTPQGHPTYRYIAQEMARLAKQAHPLLARYMTFVDNSDYELGRMDAEVKKERKKERKNEK